MLIKNWTLESPPKNISFTSIACKCAFRRTKNNYLPKRNRFLGKCCLGKSNSFNPFNPRYSNQKNQQISQYTIKKTNSKGTKKTAAPFVVAINREKKQQAADSLQSFLSLNFPKKSSSQWPPWPHVVSSILSEPKTCPRWDTCENKTKKTWFLWWIPPEILTDLCVWQVMRHTCIFMFVIVILPAGHLLLQWLHFKLEGRKSHGFSY